jgi:cardiolipin synthase A/B
VKLLIEPDDGAAPLVSAIKSAKESIDLAVFRFDHGEIEKALKVAATKGIKVNALIAHVNHGGAKSLRKLEMRFLEAGITVARSATDLLRYHNKLFVVDGRTLHLLSFNFTHLDIDRSRGFGIVSNQTRWVAEAKKLLEADTQRTTYTPGSDSFVVSPVNARRVLENFIRRARKQLLIYDPEISDKEMVRALLDRAKAGLDVRVIGKAKADLRIRKLSKCRLHTRTIIRDGSQAFVGSQSLRTAELDLRREVGLIVNERKIVRKLSEIFESDWSASAQAAAGKEVEMPKHEVDRAEKVLMQELEPITNSVKKAVQKVVAKAGDEVLEDERVKETMKKVVKKAVKQAVKEAIQS